MVASEDFALAVACVRAHADALAAMMRELTEKGLADHSVFTPETTDLIIEMSKLRQQLHERMQLMMASRFAPGNGETH